MTTIQLSYDETPAAVAAVEAAFGDEHTVERDEHTCVVDGDEIAGAQLLARVHDVIRVAIGEVD